MATTKIDYSAALVTATAAFVADGDVEAFQSAYRAIPAPSRGAAQVAALMAHPEAMASILDAINDLPAASSSRTKVTLTDDQTVIVRGRFKDAVFGAFRADDDDDIVTEAMDAAIDRLVKVIDAMPIGSSRTSYDVTLADVGITSGDVLANKKGDVTVTVVDPSAGTVDNGTVTMSLSAAAGVVLGRNQNGWAYWRHNGTLLANLRDALTTQ